jgi:hypothetical protein
LFVTSTSIYVDIDPDIIPDLKEKASISVVKDGRNEASSEYCTDIEVFCFDVEVMTSIWGVAKTVEWEPVFDIVPDIEVFLRYRGFDFDIEVYSFQYREIFEK